MSLSIPVNATRRAGSLAVWLATILGAACFLVLSAAVGIWSMFHASGEVATLRQCLKSSTSVHSEKVIEMGVGPVILGIARTGLGFVELDPEVRAAIGGVRGASVGVYRLQQPGSAVDRARMMDAMEQAMNQRGWERTVGVLNEHECVLAYVPARISSPRNLRVCVLVMDGEQWVAASVRANPEPVIEWALHELAKTRIEGVATDVSR